MNPTDDTNKPAESTEPTPVPEAPATQAPEPTPEPVAEAPAETAPASAAEAPAEPTPVTEAPAESEPTAADIDAEVTAALGDQSIEQLMDQAEAA